MLPHKRKRSSSKRKKVKQLRRKTESLERRLAQKDLSPKPRPSMLDHEQAEARLWRAFKHKHSAAIREKDLAIHQKDAQIEALEAELNANGVAVLPLAIRQVVNEAIEIGLQVIVPHGRDLHIIVGILQLLVLRRQLLEQTDVQCRDPRAVPISGTGRS